MTLSPSPSVLSSRHGSPALVNPVNTGFWSTRKVVIVTSLIGTAAVVAAVATCLLFISGAPLAAVGAIMVGLVATKIGVSSIAAVALTAAGVAIVPPLLVALASSVGLAISHKIFQRRQQEAELIPELFQVLTRADYTITLDTQKIGYRFLNRLDSIVENNNIEDALKLIDEINIDPKYSEVVRLFNLQPSGLMQLKTALLLPRANDNIKDVLETLRTRIKAIETVVSLNEYFNRCNLSLDRKQRICKALGENGFRKLLAKCFEKELNEKVTVQYGRKIVEQNKYYTGLGKKDQDFQTPWSIAISERGERLVANFWGYLKFSDPANALLPPPPRHFEYTFDHGLSRERFQVIEE